MQHKINKTVRFIICGAVIFFLAGTVTVNAQNWALSRPCIVTEKMNVFYMGVDNPISIFPDNEFTQVYIAGGAITKRGPGMYSVRVSNLGQAAVTVKQKEKTMVFNFRIKPLPLPVARIDNNDSSVIKKTILDSAVGLELYIRDFDWLVHVSVTSFEVMIIKPDSRLTAKSETGYFGSHIIAFLKKAQKGDLLFFRNIKGIINRDQQITVRDMVYTVE
jgi:GldM C-terminal domain